MSKITRMDTLKRKCEVDSGVSKKMKVEDEQQWQQLRSDMVAHLNGAKYECLGKYLVLEVKQFFTPSWVLKPAYKMSCCKCDKKACFIDVEDGLKHDWVPDHCPDHLPEYLDGEKPIDYIVDISQQKFQWDPTYYVCMVCGARALYKDTEDAENHGWWEDMDYWCPDHREEGRIYTEGLHLRCYICDVQDVFKDLDEAHKYGWWRDRYLTSFCSKCHSECNT